MCGNRNSDPGVRRRNISSTYVKLGVSFTATPRGFDGSFRVFAGVLTCGVPSDVKIAGMRSYPGVVTRVLRENSLRGRAGPAKTFRSLTSTSSANHVAAARTDQQQLASVQGLLRAAATRQGDTGGDRGGDGLRRRWGLCAAAATAAALGVDNNKVIPKNRARGTPGVQ